MGETAEYQRLQETPECDYQQLPGDEEEEEVPSSRVVAVELTDRQRLLQVSLFLLRANEGV